MPGPMGGPGRAHTTEKPKDFKKTTKKLISNYLSKYKLALIIVFILNLCPENVSLPNSFSDDGSSITEGISCLMV